MAIQNKESKHRTVIIADDHAIVRHGTRQILENLPDIDIVAEAENGLETIALVKQHSPDMLVLDAAMPLARGIEVYAEVRRWSPDTSILLLTGFTSLNLLSDWVSAGVDGILLKSCRPDEMREGFLTVLNGARYIAKEVKGQLDRENDTPVLTAREQEVLALIATGHLNVNIAERLSISPKTVEKHRGSLIQKLGVHNVAELMVYALREGLLDEHKQL
jgi:DNA-binding NarL/FixJ family response regulator